MQIFNVTSHKCTALLLTSAAAILISDAAVISIDSDGG